MRPHTLFDSKGNSPAHDRRARKRSEEVTLSSFFKLTVARLRALFAARHATDSTNDDAIGEQVTLPDAYPRSTSQGITGRKSAQRTSKP